MITTRGSCTLAGAHKLTFKQKRKRVADTLVLVICPVLRAYALPRAQIRQSLLFQGPYLELYFIIFIIISTFILFHNHNQGDESAGFLNSHWAINLLALLFELSKLFAHIRICVKLIWLSIIAHNKWHSTPWFSASSPDPNNSNRNLGFARHSDGSCSLCVGPTGVEDPQLGFI